MYNKHNHQPEPVINNFPEKDNPFWQQKIVPGNVTNTEAMQNGKKAFMIGMSMVKGIKVKEVYKQLCNSFTKLRSFAGATLKYLKYYVVSSQIDKTPDRITLYGGCYNHNTKNLTPNKR